MIAGTLLLAGTSCGWFDQPPPDPPTVDVTGTWVGPIDSTTPRGDPVYGTYSATFRLVQSGAAVTGSYSSDIGIGGSLTSGAVAGNRLTLSISTTECAGTLRVSGIVTTSPSSGPAEMDVVLAGTTACSGERQERGTLVRSAP